MPTRRTVLGGVAGLLAGCGGRQATPTPTSDPLVGLGVDTPAFEDGATIPERHTCAGADRSPALRLETPSEVAATAVVVDDVDADGFIHWSLWNVPPDRTDIPAGVDQSPAVLGAARQGTNDFGEVGYRGPCPPEGDGPHTYRFTLYGLDRTLDLEGGADPAAVDDALGDVSLGSTAFTGEFDR